MLKCYLTSPSLEFLFFNSPRNNDRRPLSAPVPRAPHVPCTEKRSQPEARDEASHFQQTHPLASPPRMTNSRKAPPKKVKPKPSKKTVRPPCTASLHGLACATDPSSSARTSDCVGPGQDRLCDVEGVRGGDGGDHDERSFVSTRRWRRGHADEGPPGAFGRRRKRSKHRGMGVLRVQTIISFRPEILRRPKRVSPRKRTTGSAEGGHRSHRRHRSTHQVSTGRRRGGARGHEFHLLLGLDDCHPESMEGFCRFSGLCGVFSHCTSPVYVLRGSEHQPMDCVLLFILPDVFEGIFHGGERTGCSGMKRVELQGVCCVC